MTSSTQPVLTDRHKTSWFQFISPAIAAFVIISGLTRGDAVAIVIGIALAAFIWFTRHTRYELFDDRLVIHYGSPRRKSYPLDDFEGVQRVKPPFQGEGLLIRRKGRLRVLITPQDPEGFGQTLERLMSG